MTELYHWYFRGLRFAYIRQIEIRLPFDIKIMRSSIRDQI